MKTRLREIDFLRGIAIILVLFRHQYLFKFTQNMGWIGVDLFFVISGFLVSGILFKEYQEFGNINPKLFLIRRGFKIYPIYYLFYILYFIPIFINKNFSWPLVFNDLIFIQNYTSGWGYAYAASWSLAVEEHFYFCFAIFLGLIIYFDFLNPNKKILKMSYFEISIFFLILFCFAFRFYTNYCLPKDNLKNFTMTHLRIDSLLAGVLVSYYYYFNKQVLELFFELHKKKLLILSLILLTFTPVIDPIGSFYIATFGFSMLYVSFSIILIYFLLEKNINTKLDNLFAIQTVNFVSKIGFCSYSIYIIHSFVNQIFKIVNISYFDKSIDQYVAFFVTSFLSVFLGFLMTNYIEKYFLRIRNKYYPSRII